MSDLFYINEFLDQDDKNNDRKITYKTDVSHLASVNLFIKALQKAEEKVQEAITILEKVKNPHSTVVERDAEDSRLLVRFVSTLDLAGKIIDEFQKGTSILDDGSQDIIALFTNLNTAFSNTRLKINIFSVTKNQKHANDAIANIRMTLKLFNNMKEAMQKQT